MVSFWGVHNEHQTARPLLLQGTTQAALRRSVAGRFLKIESQVTAEPGQDRKTCEFWTNQVLKYLTWSLR